MHDPKLNRFVAYLGEMRREMQERPDEAHVLRFSRAEIEQVRARFAENIRRGEERLHRLCHLLGQALFESDYDMQSVVIGEAQASGERFTLTQPLTQSELYLETDLSLGNRLLKRIRLDGGAAQLVANFIEYQPHQTNRWEIHKMISRIKAEEELWNKVVDEIFDLDGIVQRDKQLRPLSRFVKDVFGIKIVVSSPAEVLPLHQALVVHEFDRDDRAATDVIVDGSTARLTLIETKNYLDRGSKRSGWAAMKSVVAWWDKVFEIQIQPLGNYFREREFLTRESHTGFKLRREEVRSRVGEIVPLFGFYQKLLQWLFMSADGAEPTHPNVEIHVGD
ncbi:MAG: hypothetical protein KC609_20800 [Myxococcales bacterium]|nr:hypothetical protein [Myxococcales bacterium]